MSDHEQMFMSVRCMSDSCHHIVHQSVSTDIINQSRSLEKDKLAAINHAWLQSVVPRRGCPRVVVKLPADTNNVCVSVYVCVYDRERERARESERERNL